MYILECLILIGTVISKYDPMFEDVVVFFVGKVGINDRNLIGLNLLFGLFRISF